MSSGEQLCTHSSACDAVRAPTRSGSQPTLSGLCTSPLLNLRKSNSCPTLYAYCSERQDQLRLAANLVEFVRLTTSTYTGGIYPAVPSRSAPFKLTTARILRYAGEGVPLAPVGFKGPPTYVSLDVRFALKQISSGGIADSTQTKRGKKMNSARGANVSARTSQPGSSGTTKLVCPNATAPMSDTSATQGTRDDRQARTGVREPRMGNGEAVASGDGGLHDQDEGGVDPGEPSQASWGIQDLEPGNQVHVGGLIKRSDVNSIHSASTIKQSKLLQYLTGNQTVGPLR